MNVSANAETPETMSSGKVVGAVVNAIKILRYLSETEEPVGVSRIAKDTKLNTSTTFNILRTLAMHDFVRFDPVTKTYSLSLGIMEIAKGATALAGDLGAVQPLLQHVAQTHGVTITLWQPIGNNRKLLIMSAHARSTMRIQMAVGQRLPLYIGSTGRLFAAFSDASEARLKRDFKSIRWSTPLTFEQFMEDTREAKKTGWAIDRGNFASGTVLISVPVLDSEGHAAMAVTANMFAGQYSPEMADKIVADLKDFAAQVARILPL